MRNLSCRPQRLLWILLTCLPLGLNLIVFPVWAGEEMEIIQVKSEIIEPGEAVEIEGRNFYDVDHLFAWGWDGDQGFRIPLSQGNRDVLVGHLARTPTTVAGAQIQLWAGQSVHLPDRLMAIGRNTYRVTGAKLFTSRHETSGGFMTALGSGDGYGSSLIDGELVLDLPQQLLLHRPKGPTKNMDGGGIIVWVVIQTSGCEPAGNGDGDGQGDASRAPRPFPEIWTGHLVVDCGDGPCDDPLGPVVARAVETTFNSSRVSARSVGNKVVVSSPGCKIDQGTLHVLNNP